MAVVTKTLVTFPGGIRGAVCRVDLEYDDVTLLVRAIRTTSTLQGEADVALTRTSDQRQYSGRLATGDQSLSLPRTGTTRLFLTQLNPMRGLNLSITPPEF